MARRIALRVNWLRRHWVEIVVIGVLQAFVGWVAVGTLSLIVENQTVRDIGVLVLWALVLLIGGWVIGRRLSPADVPPYAEPTAEAASLDDPLWQESHDGWVGLPGQMYAIPGLVGRHPNLGIITPPSIIEELGKYVNEFYHKWRDGDRPYEDREAALHDMKALHRFKEEFGPAVDVVHKYLAVRGVDLDTTVDSVREIRALARRLDEASEWENWPK